MTPAEDRAFSARLTAECRFLRNFAIKKFQREWADAEDLAQDTLMRAWRGRHTYTERYTGSLRVWLCTIMTNRRYEQHRHEKLVAYSPLEEVYEDGNPKSCISEWFGVSGGQEETVALHETLRVVSQLPPHHAGSLMMAARGMTFDEMAVASNVAVGTVKSRVSRARKVVRAKTG